MSVDATVAGPSANSYLTVDAADGLAADDFGPEREAWLDAGLEAKEQALKRATREIDGYMRSSWLRFDAAQRLVFPRETDFTTEDDESEPYIPWPIRQAAYQQAIYLVRNGKVIANAATRRARDMSLASEPNVQYTMPAEESPMLCKAARHFIDDLRFAAARGVQTVRLVTVFE